MKTKYIPAALERGPDQNYNGQSIRLDIPGYGGAVHLGWEGNTMSEAPDHYANLLKAAPELLVALEAIVRKSYLRPGKYEDCHVHPDLIQAARVAIAKAKSAPPGASSSSTHPEDEHLAK